MNLTSKTAKEILEDTFQRIGGVTYFAKWALKNPGEFYPIWSKLIPRDLKVSGQIGIATLLIDAGKLMMGEDVASLPELDTPRLIPHAPVVQVKRERVRSPAMAARAAKGNAVRTAMKAVRLGLPGADAQLAAARAIVVTVKDPPPQGGTPEEGGAGGGGVGDPAPEK